MQQFKQKFIDEANELIESLENDLLLFEKNPENIDLQENILRNMHTLKGSGAMFGFNKIVKISHKVESIFNKIQNNEITVSEKIINICFQATDTIRKFLNDTDNKNSEKIYENIIEELNNFFPEKELQNERKRTKNSDFKIFYINFEPDADIENRGIKIDKIFLQIDEIGEMKIIPKLNNDENLYPVGWEIYIATSEDIEVLEEIMMFVELECEITLLSDKNLFINKKFINIVNNNAKNENLFAPEELLKIVENISTEKQKTKPDIAENFQTKSLTIRVEAKKLDDLMMHISKLITLKSEIKLIAKQTKLKNITDFSEKLGATVEQIKNDVFEIRLIKLESIRIQFERLVRDTSILLKKNVQFKTEGMNTKLDKTVISKLSPPLLHIIRNSIAHGIEDEDTRIEKGKTAHGNIKLKAYQSGSYVFIEISDDGLGIDKKRIKEKAVEKKIITGNEKLSDEEIYNLIFIPGFSTAKNLSEVSGRGMGMDVVKSEIQKMRGKVEIKSKIDAGTTITLKLPLSMSIIDTLLVKTGKSSFAIPIEEISKCTIFGEKESKRFENKYIEYNSDLIPYIYLHEKINIKNTENKNKRAVILKKENKYTAIIVDKVIGEYQAVVKPLGRAFKNKKYFSGGSFTADGNIVFIINTQEIFNDSIFKL